MPTNEELAKQVKALKEENASLKEASKPAKPAPKKYVKMYIFKVTADPHPTFFGYSAKPAKDADGYWEVSVPAENKKTEMKRQFGRLMTAAEFKADYEAQNPVDEDEDE